MRTSLRIELADSEGALMRLIGLVERRGFTIAAMDKSETSGSQSTVTLSLDARDEARNMDVLARQVARLLDVRSVFTRDPGDRIAPEIAARAAPSTDRWRQACPPRH
ncbi:ACT domain-containing protein [Maricaulis sp.]|uniref:ACT domain-containing protein n=1 Tax=Maricaulis sp. TaxID=1486257 RepID=UPI002B26C792|nr:ACT domain-containing protein [Maricaulis sp.]